MQQLHSRGSGELLKSYCRRTSGMSVKRTAQHRCNAVTSIRGRSKLKVTKRLP